MNWRNSYLLVCCLGVASVLWAGAVVSEFRAEPGRNKVVLKWIAEAEINLKGFEIERGVSKTDLQKVDFLEAKGNATAKTEYAYEDNTVFKTEARVYFYRLKILDHDGAFTLTNVIEVNPTISSARATWGSIKAMFR